MSTITVGPGYAFNSSTLDLSQVLLGKPMVASANQLTIESNGYQYDFYGTGVTYDKTGMPVSGTILELKVVSDAGALAFDITQLSASAQTVAQDVVNGAAASAFVDLIGDDVTFVGGARADVFTPTGLSSPRTFTVTGGGGNDTLSGGGNGVLVLSGAAADYTITYVSNAGSQFYVKDDRPGAPDGLDTVSGFKTIQFADGARPFESSQEYVVRGFITQVLRVDPLVTPNLIMQDLHPASFMLYNEAIYIERGNHTVAQAINDIALFADATTSVATMCYQFFIGSAPTPAGLDYLVSPTGSNVDNLNSKYYSQFNTTNRYINFASNLGKVGAGAAAFQASYGDLTLAQATSKAYAAIFGVTPTADKVNHLLNDLVSPPAYGGSYARENYFASYGGDGLNGIGTKAAMVGWLIAEADRAHVGTLETANLAYLGDLALGKISGSVDLVGTYHGTPYTGG